jgi:hypothetical protein
MADTTVPLVEALRIDAVQPLHPACQPAVRGLQQKMNMVVHQAVGETAPPSSLDRETEQAQVCPPIDVVEIDRLLGIPARIHVVDASLDFLAGSPGHMR